MSEERNDERKHGVEWHVRPPNPKNPIVFFDVTIGNIPAGRIKMELFADLAPKTAENFRVMVVDVFPSMDSSLMMKTLLLNILALAFCRWETLERYSEDIREVTVSIVEFITMSLGIEDTQISESFREGLYDIRMNCYPPCPEPERVLGIVPHADNSGITLLLDCADFPGLQFLKDKKWVNVDPIEGAIVVNIGQIIEVMSNGIYKAPEHRAVVNKLKERVSIVKFCYPSPHTDIGPANKLIRKGNVAVYKKLTHAEYFTKFFNRDLAESFIDSLRV